MADSTNGKGWKTVGIIALVIGAIYVLISLFRGWNPMNWLTSNSNPNTPTPPADGTPCSVTENGAEVAGAYKGGICTTSGHAGNGGTGNGGNGGEANPAGRVRTLSQNKIQQLQANGFNITSPSQMPPACEDWILCAPSTSNNNCADDWARCVKSLPHMRTQNAPQTIILPFNINCKDYNSAHPYHANGCSYIFSGYAVQGGQRVCQLNKVSCP